MPINKNQLITPLQYRIKAAELRQEAETFRSHNARARALLIAQQLELRAIAIEVRSSHFDDLD